MRERVIFVCVNIRSKSMRVIISLIVFLVRMGGVRGGDRMKLLEMGVEQGVCESRVVEIIEDKGEKMWIGSDKGLKGYEG